MAVQTEELLKEDTRAAAGAIVAELRQAVEGGRAWYPALLDAIARWPLSQEWVDGRYYRYLIGGEAFDWLLLAERLVELIAGLVPLEERLALLFHARPPAPESAEEFRAAIGAAKHRAHLNFVYGVVVEEALQLAVEEDLHKELRCRVWDQDRRVDDTAFERIYGKPKQELLAAFREQRALGTGERISLTEVREFTYWLFKYRMKQLDGARVASDTRRGLVQLSRMEGQRRALKLEQEPAEPADLIEGRASAI